MHFAQKLIINVCVAVGKTKIGMRLCVIFDIAFQVYLRR